MLTETCHITLDHTPCLDGSAVVSAANGDYVEVDVPLSPTERRQIRAIVDYLKPAHTHFVDLVEPMPPPVFDHWELGISELGVTSDLH